MSDRQPAARLRRFPVIDTDNRDAMRDTLVHRYGASGFDSHDDAEAFRGVANYLRLKNLDLSYGALSADATAIFSGDDLIRQQFVLSGHSNIAFGRSRASVGDKDAALIPPLTDFRCGFHGDFSQLFLRIPAAALRSKLSSLLGRAIGLTVEFAPGLVHQTPEQMQLRRLIDYFVGEVDRPGTTLTEFHLAEYEQLLIVSFLTANTHNFSHLLQGAMPEAAPWQVRRVEDYIEANWRRALTIEEIAEQTGVGVRSMFLTFKRTRGYTPMSFLQRIRLEQARRMLQTPDEATSVTAVSLQCGFHNAGHFARYYRQAFNELPSATLAEAKGARRSTQSDGDASTA
jgi:AraC-like DNA-binding protein